MSRIFAGLASATTSTGTASTTPTGDALTAYLIAKALHGKGMDTDAFLKIMLLSGASQNSTTGGFSPTMLLALGGGQKMKDQDNLLKLIALSSLNPGTTSGLSPAMLLALTDGGKLFGTTKSKA